MSVFFSQIVGESPMILLAAMFGVIGWRRLQKNHRTAAWWLLAGMAGLLLRALLDAFRVVVATRLTEQLHSGEIDVAAIASHMNVSGAISLLLLVLSISGIAMAAISGRNSMDQKVPA